MSKHDDQEPPIDPKRVLDALVSYDLEFIGALADEIMKRDGDTNIYSYLLQRKYEILRGVKVHPYSRVNSPDIRVTSNHKEVDHEES